MATESMHEESTLPSNVVVMATHLGHRWTGSPMVVRRLRAALGSPYAGDTWGDFMRAMAEAGVRPNDVIGSIEFGVALRATGRLCIERDANDAIDVREAR